MLISYGCDKCKNRWWQSNAPLSNLVRWPGWSAGAMPCTSPNGGGPELHSKPLDATIGQVFAPYHPSGQRGCMQENSTKKAPYLLAISMAVVVRRYNTVCIAQWRGSRAMTEATGWRHRASIAGNSRQLAKKCRFFRVFSLLTCWKGARGDVKAPNNNRGNISIEWEGVKENDLILGWGG